MFVELWNPIYEFTLELAETPTLMPESRSKDADIEGGKSGRSEYLLLDRDTSDVQISRQPINPQEPDLAENQISLSKLLDCEAGDQMNLGSEKL